MKKIASILALALIVCLALTACGGGNQASSSQTEAPTQAATAAPVDNADSADSAGDVTEAYVQAMNGYVSAFDQIMQESIPALLDLTDSIETDEDLQAWCVTFIELKEAIGQAADDLADIVADVPEEYQESHIKVTIATAAVYDAMTGFENAVDAAINGDEDAFMNGVAEFVGNMAGAEELWNEAVE